MVKHKKIYLEFWGYGEQDLVPSEYSGLRAEHIHHLKGRISDEVWNTMALTGEEHDRVHIKPGGKEFNELLQRIHAEKLRLRGYKDWEKALP